MITIKSDQKEAKRCYENSLKNKRSVSYVTTTPPPSVKPRSTATEEAAGRDVEMVDVELGERNAGLEEEEARNRPEEAREQGIARAVIARESRPKPVEHGSKGRSEERSSSWEDLWRSSSRTRSPR